MSHVEILHQPSHRRHGDIDRHGVGWCAHRAELARRLEQERSEYDQLMRAIDELCRKGALAIIALMAYYDSNWTLMRVYDQHMDTNADCLPGGHHGCLDVKHAPEAW